MLAVKLDFQHCSTRTVSFRLHVIDLSLLCTSCIIRGAGQDAPATSKLSFLNPEKGQLTNTPSDVLIMYFYSNSIPVFFIVFIDKFFSKLYCIYGQAAVTYRFPSDHRSQAPSSGVSTWMGDHPGTPRAVGNTWCTRHMAKPRPQVGRVC